MDKIKSLKVKQADGTLGPAIALGADAANVDMANGSTVETAITALNGALNVISWVWDSNYLSGNDNDLIMANQIYQMYKEGKGCLIVMTHDTHGGIYAFNRKSSDTMLIFKNLGYSESHVAGTAPAYGQSITVRRTELLFTLNTSTDTITSVGINALGESQYSFLNTRITQSQNNSLVYTPSLPMHPATKKYVDELIGNLSSLNIEVVTTLPTANISSSTIYLMEREDGNVQNVYEEYIYVNNKWEMIGTTEIDTSTFDEVYVGSDTPTSESVEIWIDPNGEASEDNTDVYTKAEIDAMFTALASQYVKQVNGTTTALWMGTQEQYDAIATKDATTTYIIQGTTE